MPAIATDFSKRDENRHVVEIMPLTILKKTRRLPPSMNERVHWAIRSAWTKAFREEAFYQFKSAKIPPMFKITLTIENQTTHPTDYDNLAACAKPLIDGMTLAGVIPDDDPEHLTMLMLRSERVLHRKDERLLLIVERAV